MTMKNLATLLLISASLAGTAAYAHRASDDLDYPPEVVQTSSLTRAEVLAVLQAAIPPAPGTTRVPYTTLFRSAASTLTREQVQAEAAAARAHRSASNSQFITF